MRQVNDPVDRKTSQHHVLRLTLTFIVCVLSRSPSVGEIMVSDCDDQGEVVAVYECQSGLVLWLRSTLGLSASMVQSDKALCRLVIRSEHPTHAEGRCL